MVNFQKIIDEIKNLMRNGKHEQAVKKLIASIEPERLSDPNYLETVFSLYIMISDPSQYFLKYLQITKVPPLPIDTSHDIGRRFFYALYLLNRNGGINLVTPYIESIIPNRMLEYRFLAGMYFFNCDYKNAIKYYSKAFEMIKDHFSEINHLLICGNLGACYLYSQDYENYEKIKEKSKQISNNHDSVIRVYTKYDLIKFFQLKDLDGAKKISEQLHLLKTEFIKKNNKFDQIFVDYILSPPEHKLVKLENNLKIFHENHKLQIYENSINPERYFVLCAYLDQVLPEIPESCQFIFDYKNTSYPFGKLNILNVTMNDSTFISKNDPSLANYINLETEEYYVNGKKGIGINHEIRALYYLIRAEKYGLSFEGLASLIYSHEDFAGLFLIKERIKQIIHRLKNHYEINAYAKNYRAYLDHDEISKTFISNLKKLRIHDQFTLKEFMAYYEVSLSKAKNQVTRLSEKSLIICDKSGKQNIYKKTSN